VVQKKKKAKLVIPSATICGQTIKSFNVMVTRFDPTWGIAAVIGLDFFRRFKVTIDYGKAVLVCEPLLCEGTVGVRRPS
jgi:hypothetical protein